MVPTATGTVGATATAAALGQRGHLRQPGQHRHRGGEPDGPQRRPQPARVRRPHPARAAARTPSAGPVALPFTVDYFGNVTRRDLDQPGRRGLLRVGRQLPRRPVRHRPADRGARRRSTTATSAVHSHKVQYGGGHRRRPPGLRRQASLRRRPLPRLLHRLLRLPDELGPARHRQPPRPGPGGLRPRAQLRPRPLLAGRTASASPGSAGATATRATCSRGAAPTRSRTTPATA